MIPTSLPMKLTVCTLPVLLASLCIPAAAQGGGWLPLSEQRRNELRDAVETHRASQRAEVRREETAAGRRLTAAELAQLRAQVRQQWGARPELVQATGPALVGRPDLVEAPPGVARPAPRPQRPPRP